MVGHVGERTAITHDVAADHGGLLLLVFDGAKKTETFCELLVSGDKVSANGTTPVALVGVYRLLVQIHCAPVA